MTTKTDKQQQQDANELSADTDAIVQSLEDGDNVPAAEILSNLVARNENPYAGAPEPFELRPMLAALKSALDSPIAHATRVAERNGVGYAAGPHFDDRPGFAALVIIGENAEKFRPTLDGLADLARTV